MSAFLASPLGRAAACAVRTCRQQCPAAPARTHSSPPAITKFHDNAPCPCRHNARNRRAAVPDSASVGRGACRACQCVWAVAVRKKMRACKACTGPAGTRVRIDTGTIYYSPTRTDWNTGKTYPRYYPGGGQNFQLPLNMFTLQLGLAPVVKIPWTDLLTTIMISETAWEKFNFSEAGMNYV